ncbi:MAG: extracellular solute-binding protein [Candidatus Limnocylindrales bacterium]
MNQDRRRHWGMLGAAALLAAACTGAAGTPTVGPTGTSSTAPTASAPPATATPGATATVTATATATAPGPTDAPTATPTGAPPSGMPTSVGEGEGALNVLAWPGYAEDGSFQPEYDWVHPFETATGCDVSATFFGTSDEAFRLFAAGGFDVVSASGDAAFRLADGGFVSPVNTDLVPNYIDVIDVLKDKPWNTFDGVHYGIPHGRGANLLMWNTEEVSPAPTSWMSVYDPDSPYATKITAYDAPIYIADAAVVLMTTHPELGITDPYSLDETQFAAAVDLTRQQRPLISEYWSDYLKQMDAFRNGVSVLGTTWQVIPNLLQIEEPPVPVDVVKPVEGATGWSDTWMVSSTTEHVNCAYKWLDWIVSPQTNADVAYFYGESPANSKSCDLIPDATHCEIFHADADDGFWDDVYYWNTPRADCLDGRGPICVDYNRWIDAWIDIKG